MKVAYILDVFPVLSETFVVREMLELRKLGVDLSIYALRQRDHELTHGFVEGLVQETHYLPRKNKSHRPKILLSHIKLFLTNPKRYCAALALALKYGRKTLSEFFWAAYFIEQFKKTGITHIHAHFALDGAKYAMLISALTSIPYSFTIHAHDIFLKKHAEALVDKFNRAKFVASISRFNKRYIMEHYPAVSSDQFRFVHCGIEMDHFPLRDYKEQDKLNILSTGRLVEQKGFRYLVEACGILKNERGLDFSCNIIGEGVDRAELEEMIKQQNLEGTVHLLGAMEHSFVKELLLESDLFAMPCVVTHDGTMDGIPVALMEAMAVGVPVISTRVSGIPELINDRVGKLVDEKDAQGMAQAIAEFARRSHSDRIKMGQEARKVIDQEFNSATEAARLLSYFKE